MTYEDKDEIIARLTAENAVSRQRVSQLEEQAKRLEEQVRELLARLSMNSSKITLFGAGLGSLWRNLGQIIFGAVPITVSHSSTDCSSSRLSP